MPASRSVARFNRVVTNRVLGNLARYLPGFGVIGHTGRTSGHRYATPVNVFRRDDGFLVALTYGPEADWVRNVLAAGEATLTTRGLTLRLDSPRLIHDETRRAMPPLVRWILGRVEVSDFLALKIAGDSRAT